MSSGAYNGTTTTLQLQSPSAGLAVDALERCLSRAADHQSFSGESRSMTRTVPRPLGAVPANEAAHVRADGAHLDDVAGIGSMDRDAAAAEGHDAAAASRN